MIGAMPAVAVRHERRKGQEKRSKRPSQLYIGGHWLPPNSPSPTPSANGHYDENNDRLPEFYICGKVSTLQLVVGSLLLGAIVLVVGLVQLVPNAADADHRYIFIGTGSILLLLGLALTGVRCCCMQCRHPRVVMEDPPPPVLETVHSIDVLVQRRDTQISEYYKYLFFILCTLKITNEETTTYKTRVVQHENITISSMVSRLVFKVSSL